MHIVAHPRATTQVRVAMFPEAERLLPWCRRNGVRHAVTGGYFSREQAKPLGEIWMHGLRLETVPFGKKHAGRRSALFADEPILRIAPLRELPTEPRGDLLTAGPMLARDGRSLMGPGADYEGIPETWKGELDDDWTQMRAQRTAIGYDDAHIWTVVCDGQSSHVWEGFRDDSNKDAGLNLEELAEVMLGLGAREAMNLDGGGGATLVYKQRLLNKPRAGKHDPEGIGNVMPHGRPIHSALTFLPR